MVITDWKVTDNRYVAFFDIMGFKDLVARYTHEEILEKLQLLSAILKFTQQPNGNPVVSNAFKELGLQTDRINFITFSDSIFIFSQEDSKEDLRQLIAVSSILLSFAFLIGIALKGAMSYGKITVDFGSNLFYGQPIIDAYLLHEDLLIYSASLDNNIEKKVNELQLSKENLYQYHAPFKGGKIRHLLVKPFGKPQPTISSLEKLYEQVSGRPRIYIDHTIDFIKYILASESQ